MRHTISVLVENEFGVLARVAGLFSGRGFNIESLTVAETLDPTVSRITLVTRGDDQVLEQIEKQLNKLVPVIKVIDFGDSPHVEREMALVKVTADEKTRAEVMNLIDIFRGKVIDVGPRSYIVGADRRRREDPSRPRPVEAARAHRDRPHRQGGDAPRHAPSRQQRKAKTKPRDGEG